MVTISLTNYEGAIRPPTAGGERLRPPVALVQFLPDTMCPERRVHFNYCLDVGFKLLTLSQGPKQRLSGRSRRRAVRWLVVSGAG